MLEDEVVDCADKWVKELPFLRLRGDSVRAIPITIPEAATSFALDDQLYAQNENKSERQTSEFGPLICSLKMHDPVQSWWQTSLGVQSIAPRTRTASTRSCPSSRIQQPSLIPLMSFLNTLFL
jgi:hypothetical protein